MAARDGMVLYELTPQKASLEDAFMRLTGELIDFRAAA
jgi:ABC-2 type transport system ATP-binding protein